VRDGDDGAADRVRLECGRRRTLDRHPVRAEQTRGRRGDAAGATRLVADELAEAVENALAVVRRERERERRDRDSLADINENKRREKKEERKKGVKF
jgi:hypothetical protein